MNAPPVNVAVEGNSDEALARALLRECELTTGVVYVQKGKDNLDKKLKAFNQAANHAPWLVLRDLDQDADCPPELLEVLLEQRAPYMVLRIAVHAAESWLLADRKRMSEFLRVAPSKISSKPDLLDNPKLELVNLARKSRRRSIREDMAPADKSTASVGPAYVSRLIEFASNHWRPREAAKSSESLKKCIVALERLRQTLK